MGYPTELKYTNDHEWLKVTEGNATVGITQFAVEQLGDITLVELPKPGATITKGERFGTVESVKSVSDLYAPISGTVTKINQTLVDKPEMLNEDAYNGGWMIEVTPSTTSEIDQLLSAEDYLKIVEQ